MKILIELTDKARGMASRAIEWIEGTIKEDDLKGYFITEETCETRPDNITISIGLIYVTRFKPILPDENRKSTQHAPVLH